MIERDPLNFFSPYERLVAGHENQLTRALLLVLRMSPLAHVEWLRLVDPRRSLGSLGTAQFATQRRAIRTTRKDVEDAELVSVFLAPELPQAGAAEVVESDRGQVLDAVVDYGELVVVIENKVFEADDLQARRLNLGNGGVQLVDDHDVAIVLWRDLLEALTGLRERALVSGAEAAVLDDFLVYVEDHFPDLGPFRSLALCRGVSSRVERRLRHLLGEAGGRDGESSPYGPRIATPAGAVAGRDAYLKVGSRGDIELALYPADTLSQAQRFYRRPAAIDGVRQLAQSDGWHVGPNFHFGHIQRGFCWTKSDLSITEYLGLWQHEINDAGAIPRDEWDVYWEWLITHQIARTSDRMEFDRHFTSSSRKSATPRPGISLIRRWPLQEAEASDSRGTFVAEVRAALDTALRALGEPGLA